MIKFLLTIIFIDFILIDKKSIIDYNIYVYF